MTTTAMLSMDSRVQEEAPLLQTFVLLYEETDFPSAVSKYEMMETNCQTTGEAQYVNLNLDSIELPPVQQRQIRSVVKSEETALKNRLMNAMMATLSVGMADRVYAKSNLATHVWADPQHLLMFVYPHEATARLSVMIQQSVMTETQFLGMAEVQTDLLNLGFTDQKRRQPLRMCEERPEEMVNGSDSAVTMETT